jgi:hypothetical protein
MYKIGRKITYSNSYKSNVLFISLFLLYLLIRILSFKNTVLLDDYDSLFYLHNIKAFLSFDIKNIINLNPDFTPFYPIFGALFSLPGWSVEIGARLTSLFFTSLLFIAVFNIGRQLETSHTSHTSHASFISIALICFHPILIPLSFSILTEPSYISTIYLGLWLYLSLTEKSNLWKSALLGAIVGLSFLNRVEGILYIVFFPLIYAVQMLFDGIRNFRIKYFLSWSLIFLGFFSIFAIPQIYHVSKKVGLFMINGRQIHQIILSSHLGESVAEKMTGLHYSSHQININYLRNHPEALTQLKSKTSYGTYLKRFIYKCNDLYQNGLGRIIGPLGIIFFAFGILSLLEAGQLFNVLLISSFIGFSLTPELITPQVSNQVNIRHVAVIIPVIIIVEGIGIEFLSKRLLAIFNLDSKKIIYIYIAFLISLILLSAIPIRKALKSQSHNYEYSPSELKEPIRLLNEDSNARSLKAPIVTSERAYIAYLSGIKHIPLPFTTYDGLVKYCDLNNVNYLYLKYKRVIHHPFYEKFIDNPPPPDFSLIYSGVGSRGGEIELYRFENKQKNLTLNPSIPLEESK